MPPANWSTGLSLPTLVDLFFGGALEETGWIVRGTSLSERCGMKSWSSLPWESSRLLKSGAGDVDINP